MGFLLVGVPDVIFDQVMRHIRADLVGQLVLAAPLRRSGAGKYAVDAQDCLRGLEAIEKAYRSNPEYTDAGLGVVIVRRPWEEPRFSDIFFPFALVRHVVCDDATVRGAALRRTANRTAKDIAATCRSLIRPIKAVRNRYESTAGKTRILLPLENFSSATFKDRLRHLSEALPYADDPKGVLANFDDSLAGDVPSRRDRDKGSYFEDAARKWFKMPGRALHGRTRDVPAPEGAPSGTTAHNLRCFLTARLRLGGAVVEGFHYDCTASGGPLVGRFSICHQHTARYKGRPHLNIYVNDFIRA